MVEINDLAALTSALNNLQADTPASWGKMSPQNMIEHISSIVLFSNGRKSIPLLYPEEKAAAFKAYLIDSDNEFPKNFKAPLIGEEPLAYRFESLDAAKAALFKELKNYSNYHNENNDAVIMHPTLGLLDQREWTIFHNKHFTHHFKQFNLI